MKFYGRFDIKSVDYEKILVAKHSMMYTYVFFAYFIVSLRFLYICITVDN